MNECEICGLPGKQKEMSRPVGTGYKGLLVISIVFIVVGGIIFFLALPIGVGCLGIRDGALGVAVTLLLIGVGFQPLALGLVLWCLRDIAINNRKSVLAIQELRQG